MIASQGCGDTQQKSERIIQAAIDKATATLRDALRDFADTWDAMDDRLDYSRVSEAAAGLGEGLDGCELRARALLDS